MKRILPIAWIVLLFPAGLFASPVLIGADVGMPYLFRVDGNSVKTRGNLNLGLDGRYFVDENLNFGGRFGMDLQKRGASVRRISFEPGLQYRWMTHERFSPHFRFDVPVALRGAPNNVGSDSKMDVGIGSGGGLSWNLGGALGVPGMALRYDFGFQYWLGIGDAVTVLALELFKFGLEYRF
jgi:hypothetical protein